MMKTSKYQIIAEAQFFLLNNSNLRKTAKVFNVSKSLVFNHFRKILPSLNKELYFLVDKKLEENFRLKHKKGGYVVHIKSIVKKSE